MSEFYICTFCSHKYSSTENPAEFMVGKKFGVCSRCMSRLSRTDGNGCFNGGKYLSYVISSFYYDNIVRSAIHKYKFNNNYIFADVFSHFMIKTLSEFDNISDFDIIVPLPLSKKRMRERGYNQSALIAERIAEKFNIAYSKNILLRKRNTKKQSTLKGYSRISNVADAFTTECDLHNMKILLFDDIYTTGNTLNQAAKVLKNAGASEIAGATVAIVKPV